MKIKRILVYLIFAFIMVLPFNVNASEKGNIHIIHNKDFSSTVVNQLKEVIYYNFVNLRYCVSTDTMDSCFNKYSIIIHENEEKRIFDVYFYADSRNEKLHYIYSTKYGVVYQKHYNSYYSNSDSSFNDSTIYLNYMSFNISDLSLVKSSSNVPTFSHFNNLILDSDYVCINDLHNNCGNTNLDKGYRDINFWKKHGIFEDAPSYSGGCLYKDFRCEYDYVINYDSFDDLYVYSNIIWTNKTFKWKEYNSSIYLDTLKNDFGSYYKSFSYNLDSDGSYADQYTTTKTVLIDASLYDTYELNFELLGKHFNCTAPINVFNICPDKYKDYQDKYVINVYNKSITNVKYYLSADNKNWDKSSFKSSATSDYVSYGDINWNGKYGKYVFDLTGIEDYILITISYDNSVISFKTPELQIPEEEMTEVDLTGKYAVGLIPKNANSPIPLYYQGNFITYYYFGDSTKAYEYKLLKSSDHTSKYVIDFTNYNLNKPIFYLLNLDYKTQNTSIIKYSSDLFDIVYFDNEYSSVTYNDFIYNPPSSDVDIETGGDDSTDSSNGGIDLSLTSLVKKLPDLIEGLGNAFQALGDCIVIAFTSLPDIVQSVLYISLIITIILLAIKLIK